VSRLESGKGTTGAPGSSCRVETSHMHDRGRGMNGRRSVE
jgi:hypothetical protein